MILFKKTIILTLFALLPALTSLWASEEIRVSVPASMTDVFKELCRQFQTTGSHPQIVPNFGSSGALAKQIAEGAPVDLFISANQKWMTYLRENKSIALETERLLAANTLVFIGPRASGITKLADLLPLQQIAIGSPKSVPAGEYAVQALEKAGLLGQLEQRRQLVMAKDVRQALVYAERGEAQGAFVYRTDARLATEAVVLFEVPQELYDQIVYPLALTVQGAKKPEAVALHTFLTGSEARAILSRHGFSTPH